MIEFRKLHAYKHEHPIRAAHGDKNWRIYFPNGIGLDIVGGPQDPECILFGKKLKIDCLYGDGINTFEVAKFKHSYNINTPIIGLIDTIDPSAFFDEETWVTSERVQQLIDNLDKTCKKQY